MKIAVILGLAIGSVVSMPVDPDDEVEIIGSKNTNTGGGFPLGGDIPIVIVRSNFNPFSDIFGRRSGGGPVIVRTSSTDDDLDFNPFGNADFNPFALGDFFPQEIPIPGRRNDQKPDRPENCGFICRIFGNFEDQFRRIDDEIRNINDQMDKDGSENNNESEDGFDINNSTYYEKTLPDGSVIRVNSTTFSDTDENGNTFFIHSSINTFVGDDVEVGHEEEDKKDQGDKEEEKTAEEETAEEETAEENESDDKPKDTVPFLDEDDSVNEVFEDDNVGVDDGLLQ